MSNDDVSLFLICAYSGRLWLPDILYHDTTDIIRLKLITDLRFAEVSHGTPQETLIDLSTSGFNFVRQCHLLVDIEVRH